MPVRPSVAAKIIHLKKLGSAATGGASAKASNSLIAALAVVFIGLIILEVMHVQKSKRDA